MAKRRRIVSITATERLQVTLQPKRAGHDVPATTPATAGAQLAATGQWLMGLADAPALATWRHELVAIAEQLMVIGIAGQ